MKSVRTLPHRDASMPPRAVTLDNLFDVMALLKTLIQAENEHLRRGMPAPLFADQERKRRLAEDYSALSEAFMAMHDGRVIADPVRQRRLVDSAFELRALTEENMRLLEGAMAATRRRIEAILASIHRERNAAQGYGSGGRRSGPCLFQQAHLKV